MWYQLQRTLLFRLKELENGLISFARKREIRHAYRGADRDTAKVAPSRKASVPLRLPRVSLRALRGLGIVIAALLSIVLLISGGMFAARRLPSLVAGASETFSSVHLPQISLPKISRPGFFLPKQPSPQSAAKAVVKKVQVARHEGPSFPEGLEVPGPEVLAELSAASDTLSGLMHVDVRMDHLILANKASHRFYLLRRGGGDVWSLEKEFFLATGEIAGPKRTNGDRRTPVGLYFITGRKEKRELDAKYGPLCYVLNYPNEYDRRMGYSGEGIWIHGTKPDTIPFQTLGCLELDNTDVADLGETLKTGIGTPVYIVDDSAMGNPVSYPDFKRIERKRARILADYLNDRASLLALVKTWENRWEARNIAEYIDCYAPSFDGDGMKLSAWRERKSRIFASQSSITVDLGRIFVSEYAESTAVLKFTQDYTAGAMHTRNGKKLTLIKKDGTWRIYRETTIPEEEFAL